MVRSKVIVRDRGLNKILAQIKAADGLAATIGIQGTEAQESRGGITNAQLAAIHEFGIGARLRLGDQQLKVRIPERSFLRVPFDQNSEAAVRLVGKRLNAGDSEAKALGLAGEFLRGRMVRAIDAGIAPENAPSTIAKKRSSKPLIDIGQLKQSLTSKVSKRRR